MSMTRRSLVAWLSIGGVWGLDHPALAELGARWPDPDDALDVLVAGTDDLAGIVRPSHRDRVAASAADVDHEVTTAALARTHAAAVASARTELRDRLLPEAGWSPSLAVRGALESCTARPSVAIVGMRKSSPTGRRFARDLAHELAQHGVTIVSGLAYGIDAAAHQGAIAAGGAHCAVLAGGFEHIYPRPHRPLADAILGAGGALVAHVAPHVRAEGWRFPFRNRLIAGLADVVIVVEAAARGGALSTARHARDLDVTVMCVPGFPWATTAAGTNALIADGAEVCRDAGDVLTALSLSRTPRLCFPDSPTVTEAGKQSTGPLGAAAHAVLEQIEYVPVDFDELTRRTDQPMADLLCLLDELENADRVTFPSPSTVQRVDRH